MVNKDYRSQAAGGYRAAKDTREGQVREGKECGDAGILLNKGTLGYMHENRINHNSIQIWPRQHSSYETECDY